MRGGRLWREFRGHALKDIANPILAVLFLSAFAFVTAFAPIWAGHRFRLVWDGLRKRRKGTSTVVILSALAELLRVLFLLDIWLVLFSGAQMEISASTVVVLLAFVLVDALLFKKRGGIEVWRAAGEVAEVSVEAPRGAPRQRMG
jgi:membrane protease YdiL (CAAX protease family)